MNDSFDLLIFGDIVVDNFYEVNEIPEINKSADVINHKRFYGGMGANTAVCASALGLKTSFVGVVGSFGDEKECVSYMKERGVDIHLNVILGETAHSMFFKKEKVHKFISFLHKGIAEKTDEIKIGKENIELIKKTGAIFMPRTYLNLQKKVSMHCKNKFLIYNPGYGVFNFKKIPEDFYRILKNTDVLVLNKHEYEWLKERGFDFEFRMGPAAFLITKGSYGCKIFAKGIYEDIPKFKTKVVDTAGAGDAFNAGFIAGHLQGFNLIEAVKIGNATASFIVEKWGCQTNIPSWEGVMGRYERM
ncbi:hypothetical protein BEH94_01615 [Candidatus Altiarchaeales archaeon WOR_SM1_SCG]|nr:hypothetical protein BEH94_01615 [Candidatus Altiarchaeales archaeon WOR_SM1_SCG]